MTIASNCHNFLMGIASVIIFGWTLSHSYFFQAMTLYNNKNKIIQYNTELE